MASTRSEFAVLLRTWRDRLSPIDAGLTVAGRRRAPGLRREELAQLTGLSVDYLLRLEQGRATNPSAQVVGAIARTLQLSRAERDRLYRSAGLLPPQDGTVSTFVPPSIQRLAARLDTVPIGIFAADWSVVWWNSAWAALHGDPTRLPDGERNLARALFGRGAARNTMYPIMSSRGQEAFEASIVADIKDARSRLPGDVALGRLVHELREESDVFARYWDTRAAATKPGSDRKTVRHPLVGDVTLDCDILLIPGSDLRMVTYTAAAESTDAGKLDLLRVASGLSV